MDTANALNLRPRAVRAGMYPSKEGKEMRAMIREVIRWATMLAFVGVLCGVAPAQSGQAGSEGASLFKAKCAMCHGPDGSGKTMMGARLKIPDLRSEEVQKQTDAQLKETISKGKAKMPAYEGKVTPPQIDQLVSEIRELGKKK
jgi:cytochrome c6